MRQPLANPSFPSPNITNLRLNRNTFGTENDWQFVTTPQVNAGNRVQAQVQGKVLGSVLLQLSLRIPTHILTQRRLRDQFRDVLAVS